MAKDKKGFLLYADQKELFDQLPNDKAGELIKHIFKYVNDEEPQTDDLLINMAFTPIKQQFKRDLDKWENTREKRSLAGKKSAESRRNKRKQTSTKLTSVKSVEQKSTSVNKRKQTSTKLTVNDNVNVNVNDIEYIYSLYPTKCPIKNSSTGKSQKSKDRIKKLLETKDVKQIESSIKSYLEDCKKHNIWVKNFNTLLGDLPEPIKQDEFVYFMKKHDLDGTYRQLEKEIFQVRYKYHMDKVDILPKKPIHRKLVTVGT